MKSRLLYTKQSAKLDGASGGNRTLTDQEVRQLPKLVRLPISARWRYKCGGHPCRQVGVESVNLVSGAITVITPTRGAAFSTLAKRIEPPMLCRDRTTRLGASVHAWESEAGDAATSSASSCQIQHSPPSAGFFMGGCYEHQGKGKRVLGEQPRGPVVRHRGSGSGRAGSGYLMAKGQGRRNIPKEKVDAMLRRLADGESLRSICATEGMPAKCTVLGWVVDGKHPEFAESYMTARRAAGFAHADRVVEVCDKAENGTLPPQAARVMLQGLTWAAERMASKAHSTKQEVEHKGRIDGNWTITPVQSKAERDD